MKPKQRYVAKINPIVFWISKHALSLLRGLFRISIHINGAKNIPDGAIIFVANHFTRLETVFLPYELYRLTGKPVMSLAHHGLFKHILGTFLESVGSVSTKAPHRDVTIIRSLLKGNHPWLIFPEGGMIRDKKVMENGKLRISGKNGRRRPPHAGAALLALRAEFYRQRLRYLHHKNPSLQKRQLDKLQLTSLNEVNNRQTFLVPVNLSYYPFRPRKNTLEKLTTKFLGGIPDRMQDELRTEGTMLFSGVRMDITIGEPVAVASLLKEKCFQRDIRLRHNIQPEKPLPSGSRMMAVAKDLTLNIMQSVYHNTQINYDHLAAYLLKYYPGPHLHVADLAKRLCLAMETASRLNSSPLMDTPHKAHCFRFCSFYRKKIHDFLRLAEQSGVVEIRKDIIHKKRLKTAKPYNFETIRMDNPFQVILNEVEILQHLTGRLQRIARYPHWRVNRYLNKAKNRLCQGPMCRPPNLL
jgi:1-acyl-sn-glycerol-3-phosphate acyltransferase